MRALTVAGLAACLALCAAASARADGTLKLYPANPRYVEYRGRPTLLVASGEHYGAVLNRAVDYVRYLDTLKRDGLNLTRTFSGAYREIPGNFNIRGNTLAPVEGDYICPWQRTPDGRFDLGKWDEAYFRRLKDFVGQAGRRGIVVELALFCPFYEDSMWNASPLNARNNVNEVGAIPRLEVYTLKHLEMVKVQEAMVRRIVQELRDSDNLYYEICNEPYFGGVTLEWQARISQVIADSESGPRRHLIAQNIANGSARVVQPDPRVSIFNFHYASPPNAVSENRALNRPISFDETGFKGEADATYRAQAWEFAMAGGAIFSMLDYSFTAATPDGSLRVTPPTPGGGSPALRRQLAFLRRFAASWDFARVAPMSGLANRGGKLVYGMTVPGEFYAVYLPDSSPVEVRVADGAWRVEWWDPVTGRKVREERAAGESLRLEPEGAGHDWVVRLTRLRESERFSQADRSE